MNNYITTDKHPEFKEGLKIVNKASYFTINIGDEPYRLDLKEIRSWLNKGYIKEVEEKEFTKSDVIEFGKWILKTPISVQEGLEEFMKQRN